MGDQVRVGLIGVGAMGRIHAQNLLSMADVALVAVADPKIEAIERGGFGLPTSVMRTINYRDLLDLTLDAVVLSSATTTHKDILMDLVHYGRPVFCEKPLAAELEEARHVHQAICDHGLLVQMGFVRRFDPLYRRAKELIEEGRIGVPYHYWGLSRDQWAPPLDTVKNSGGFAVDTGVHEFDLVRWFFDDEFASVYARGGVFVTKALASLGDYDQVDISFRTVGEKLGLIELSRNAVYGYDVRAEILGDRGAIRVVADHRTTTALYVENQVIGDTFQTFAERFQWAYKQQLVEFVELVKGERPTTPVGSGDAVKAQEVAVAVRQSLASGQPCDLSTVESMSSFQEQIRER